MNEAQFGSEKFQADLRSKIEDLTSTLNISNVTWSSWEKEFITNLEPLKAKHLIHVSAKQYGKICDLWEKL